MYQMLTGVLPYDTPGPGDLERLFKGDLVLPPRTKNASIPKRINDIVLKAMAPDVTQRYQRAGEVIDDLLAARPLVVRPPSEAREPAVATVAGRAHPEMAGIHARLRARETPTPRFCWKCRKAIPARSAKCPFCAETQ
jgi:serine/threonine protein kinase